MWGQRHKRKMIPATMNNGNSTAFNSIYMSVFRSTFHMSVNRHSSSQLAVNKHVSVPLITWTILEKRI